MGRNIYTRMLGGGLNPQLDHLLNGLKELRIECDEGDYLDYVTELRSILVMLEGHRLPNFKTFRVEGRQFFYREEGGGLEISCFMGSCHRRYNSQVGRMGGGIPMD